MISSLDHTHGVSMNKPQSSALETDLYHIDAAYIAWKSGHNGESTFDLFTRSTPFGGGFMVAAGLELAGDHILNFHSTQEDLDW